MMNNGKQKSKKNKTKAKKTGQSPNQVKVLAPASVGQRQTIKKPRTRTSKSGNYCVSHSELVDSIIGNNDFVNSSFTINPGVQSVFPWLSQIAPNYESYKFKKLHFRYVPSVGSQQSGTMYMAPEFNNNDLPPTDESQLASYDDCVTGSVWTNHVYRCSAQNLNKRKSYFVRSGSLPSNADVDLYDVGYLNITALDCGSTLKVGKLWVDYDVEFMTPQSAQPGVGRALSAKFTANGEVAMTKLGNAPLVSTYASPNYVFTATQAYQCLVSVLTSTAAAPNPPFTLGGTAAITPVGSMPSPSGASAMLTALVSFQKGQTLTVDPLSGVSAATVRFAQYDVQSFA